MADDQTAHEEEDAEIAEEERVWDDVSRPITHTRATQAINFPLAAPISFHPTLPRQRCSALGCKDDGTLLILCDKCVRAYHADCLRHPPEEGEDFCCEVEGRDCTDRTVWATLQHKLIGILNIFAQPEGADAAQGQQGGGSGG
jgi:hypothetical protein